MDSSYIYSGKRSIRFFMAFFASFMPQAVSSKDRDMQTPFHPQKLLKAEVGAGPLVEKLTDREVTLLSTNAGLGISEEACDTSTGKNLFLHCQVVAITTDGKQNWRKRDRYLYGHFHWQNEMK